MDKLKVKAINLRKLRMIGILPEGFDSSNQQLEADKTKISFSKIYKTYLDYEKDIKIAKDCLIQYRELPDDIFNKLRETALELGIVTK